MTLTNEQLETDINIIRMRLAEATNTLTERISTLDTQLETEIERIEERCRVQRNDLAVLGAKQRQELRHELTTRIVDTSVQLRKVIDALDDKTTAEIAALSGRVDLSCAGC